MLKSLLNLKRLNHVETLNGEILLKPSARNCTAVSGRLWRYWPPGEQATGAMGFGIRHLSLAESWLNPMDVPQVGIAFQWI